MTAQCISPIQGSLARIVRLDACGIPVTGAGSLIVFDGFVSVAVSPQYEDGTSYQKKRANGSFCLNRRGNDQFTRDELTVDFCAIDPDAVVITTGQTLVATGAPATGTGFWQVEGDIEARWSLEVWQADGETCTGTNPRTAYWAWPNLTAGRLNDFTIEDGALTWQITASTEQAHTLWGAGPGAVKYISAVPAGAHRGFNITSLPLPSTTGCGAATLAAA